MKKLAITGIAAGDIANLRSVYVKTQGENIIVEGQNGAGKSTLAKTIMWTLIGSTGDGEKLIPINGDGLPYAEIELSDGKIFTKFRKEMVQKIFAGKISRTTDCFMNGIPVAQKDFQEFYTRYVPTEMFEVLMNLGSFFKLRAVIQREILTELFGNINDEEVIATDEELRKLKLGAKTVESYIAEIKREISKLKKSAESIPAKISELERQTAEVMDDRKAIELEKVALQTELTDVLSHLATWKELRDFVMDLQSNLSDADQTYWQRKKESEECKDRIKKLESELESLREEWRSVKDTCPTCGQQIDSEKAEKIREQIALNGKRITGEIEQLKTVLSKINERRETALQKVRTLQEKVKSQQYDSTEYDLAVKRRDELQREIAARDRYIAKIETQLEINARNDRRIEELKLQEKEHGRRFGELEHQLALVEKFTQKKMELITDAINKQFQHVRFSMFEVLKSGEVKNSCTATLGGVPYENLSKGEKFKAALDVLQAFQNYYGVMLPLIIDDAESYTSNSLINIPNQKILLIAVEGQAELQISCGKAESRSVA